MCGMPLEVSIDEKVFLHLCSRWTRSLTTGEHSIDWTLLRIYANVTVAPSYTLVALQQPFRGHQDSDAIAGRTQSCRDVYKASDIHWRLTASSKSKPRRENGNRHTHVPS